MDTKTTGEITRTMSETTVRRFEVRDVGMPLPAPLVGKSPQPFMPDDEDGYYEDQAEGSEEEEDKEEGTDNKSKRGNALRRRKEKDARNAATEAEEDELAVIRHGRLSILLTKCLLYIDSNSRSLDSESMHYHEQRAKILD